MPVISTRYFRLRPIVKADAPRFAELCNDKTIAHNTARIPHPYTDADAAGFVARAAAENPGEGEIVFAVCRDDVVIACVGLSPDAAGVFELGYWVGGNHRRQGVAAEAAGAVCNFAFSILNARMLTAGYFMDNPPSGRVLTRLGFTQTGKVAKMFSIGRGCDVDTVRMALRQQDFICPENIAP